MNLADVTIVLPTKNERHTIAAFLRGIPFTVPLIVVDASDDGTADFIERLGLLETGPDKGRRIRQSA